MATRSLLRDAMETGKFYYQKAHPMGLKLTVYRFCGACEKNSVKDENQGLL